MAGQKVDLGVARVHSHKGAGQKDHRDVEILNNLRRCGNALVEDLLSKHVEKRNQHDPDQADAGDIRYVLKYPHDHAVDLIIQGGV